MNRSFILGIIFSIISATQLLGSTATITGPFQVCRSNTQQITYTTESGKTNYVWTASGGTVVSQTGATAIVTWNALAYLATLQVTYTNPDGSTGAGLIQMVILPAAPVTFNAPTTLCDRAPSVTISATAGMQAYSWVPQFATINSGNGTNTINVNWRGPSNIALNYTDAAGCLGTATYQPQTLQAGFLDPIPATSVCSYQQFTTTLPNTQNYTWTSSSPSGVTGATASGNTAQISNNLVNTGNEEAVVTYAVTPIYGSCPGPVTNINVTVNPILKVTNVPPTPTSICSGDYFTFTPQVNQSGSYTTWTTTAGSNINGVPASGSNTFQNSISNVNPGHSEFAFSITPRHGACSGPVTNMVMYVNSAPVMNPIINNTSICSPFQLSIPFSSNINDANVTYSWVVSENLGNVQGATGGTGVAIVNNLNFTGSGVGQVTYTITPSFFGCTGPPKTSLIYVQPPTVPVFLNDPVCNGTTANYSTIGSQSNYVWSVTGGTIASGQSTKDISVNWTTAGTQSITLSYSPFNNCVGTTTKQISIMPLPVPSITGPATACITNPVTINSYSTDPGKTNYVWTNTFNSFSATTQTASMPMPIPGNFLVKVAYTDGNGCVGSNSFPVTVTSQPSATLTGSSTGCVNSSDNTYATQSGKSNYSWNVTGGTISSYSGSSLTTSNSITVRWTTPGAQSVSVSYTNVGACVYQTQASQSVTVTGPTISGPAATCMGSPVNHYTTETGKTNYAWSVTGPATISSGQGTAAVDLYLAAAGTATLTCTYTDPNSGCVVTATKSIAINLPGSISLTGQTYFCGQMTASATYSTEPGKSNYTWSATGNSSITPNGNTCVVNWNGSGSISVSYTDLNSCRLYVGRTITFSACAEALSFSGSTTYVNVPEINGRLNLGSSDFTIETFIQASAFPPVTSILSKRSFVTGATSDGFLFGLLGTGPFVQLAGSPNIQPVGMPTLNDGKCHQLAVKRTAGAIVFYLDGVLYGTNNYSSLRDISQATQGLAIGRDFPSGVGYTGWVGEVRVWNTALSTAQIASNMTHDLSQSASLKGYYDMKDPVGSQTLTDLSMSGGSNGILGSSTIVDAADPAWLTSSQVATVLASSTPLGGNFRTLSPTSYDVIEADTAQENQSDLKIYPIPARGKINLEIKRTIGDKALIQLLDFSGQIVKVVELNQGDQRVVIDVENFETGIYFIQLNLPNEIIRRKIIVVKN